MAKRGAKGRRRCRDESVRAPQPFSDITDLVCYKDKKYFEENPVRSSYLRRYVHGEFWPSSFIGDTWVLVDDIYPGLRMRMPCTIEDADDAKIGEKVGEVRSRWGSNPNHLL